MPRLKPLPRLLLAAPGELVLMPMISADLVQVVVPVLLVQLASISVPAELPVDVPVDADQAVEAHQVADRVVEA